LRAGAAERPVSDIVKVLQQVKASFRCGRRGKVRAARQPARRVLDLGRQVSTQIETEASVFRTLPEVLARMACPLCGGVHE